MSTDKWVIPHIDNLTWLSKVAGPYPASRQDIEEAAIDWHFSNLSIDFIRLFSSNEIFMSREDFMARCEELESQLRHQQRHEITPEVAEHQAA